MAAAERKKGWFGWRCEKATYTWETWPFLSLPLDPSIPHGRRLMSEKWGTYLLLVWLRYLWKWRVEGDTWEHEREKAR